MNNKTIVTNIEKEYVIKASLDEVWDCLSNGDISSFWQGQECVIGEKIGDTVNLFGGWVTGKILELLQHKRIIYSWKVEEWGKNTEPSVVDYQLDELDEKIIKVNLIHSNLPSVKERDSHEKGWDINFFDPIKDFLKNVNN